MPTSANLNFNINLEPKKKSQIFACIKNFLTFDKGH